MTRFRKFLLLATPLLTLAAWSGVRYLTPVAYEAITHSSIDSTPVGAASPSTGAFTYLSAANGLTTNGLINLTQTTTVGIQNNGNYNSTYNVTAANFIGALLGNASTVTAFQTTPTNCGGPLGGSSYGIDNHGNALCNTNSHTFNNNGYQYLPDGLIIQWAVGASAVNGRGQTSVTLPIAFPHACLSAELTVEFTSQVTTTNNQGAAFYLQPSGCGLSSVSMQYDVRPDGTADSSYVPRVLAVGW